MKNNITNNVNQNYLDRVNLEDVEDALEFLDTADQNNNKEISDTPTKPGIIPEPFFIEKDELWINVKGEGRLLCRQVPYIIKKLNNIEDNTVSYILCWKDDNLTKTEVVSSIVLSVKKELLSLSEKGLGVNENNYKQMISFFDKYLSENKVKQETMVNRLGHIKNGFIHPLILNDIIIVPNDAGEKQILEAIQEKGTVESWRQEVLELVKPLSKSLFYLVASFTAPLLHDFQIDSFIVDFSGHTSQGKTTLLRLSSTVWGTSKLINEWESTRVSIERKAAFLNSFPLFMDDTKKANPKQLESVIYQFSGGRSRGRGSLKGIQKELTWRTILLSTGESSILQYTNGGGVAGRVVPINDEPFGKPSNEFMEKLYKGINNNYGVVGRVFIQKWMEIDPEYKESYKSTFYDLKNNYIKLAGSNEVLIRIASYYAIIHFVATLLNELMDFKIDPTSFKELFKVAGIENREVDKPKQLMEDILESLDSFRSSIHYGYFEPTQINGLFDKSNRLYLTTSYTNKFLGPEAKAIKHEWLKRGYIIPSSSDGKESQTKKLGGRAYKAIEVNQDLLTELGFDFSDTGEKDY